MDFHEFSGLVFLGAIAIFIYGIRLARAGIQLLAGDRLRGIIAALTKNRFKAVGVGTLVTLILQSSNATTITLVGFVAAGTMTLEQAMGIILGADIGTTFVVILLAIEEIATYSLLLLIIGIIIEIASNTKRGRYVSMFLMGFGFIFFGMKLMVQVSVPLSLSPLLQEILLFLAKQPLFTLLATALFTMLVQNSAAPIGLAIALAFSGLITLPAAVPIVLGANVGTCSGSLFASLGSNAAGKRVAYAHLLLKVVGAALALLALQAFIRSIDWISSLLPLEFSISGKIALAHLLFNLYVVVLFLPLIGPGAWLVYKLLPQPREAAEEKLRSRYLDKKSLEVPSLAFANVRRELLRLVDLNQEMFRDCLQVFKKNDRVLMETIQAQDDQVDLLDREVKFYLARLSQESLTSEQADTELSLLAMTACLEEIGDVITKNILELADKKVRTARHFSEAGWKEIAHFHGQILENFQIVAGALATEDEALAKKALRHHEQLAELERQYRQGHLNRLHQGLKETFETSSIHLDLLSNLYRIDDLLADLVRQAYPKL